MSDETPNIIPAKFAGSFYPSDPDELQQLMASFEGERTARTPNQPKAYIMPHAGFRFSGETAARAAIEMRGNVRRVVILGPSHRHAFDGIATTDADKFDTPFQAVPIDQRARRAALRLDFVNLVPEAFENEHSIEVELPWIRKQFPRAGIAPFIVGNASSEEVAHLINIFWGDFRTAFIISTDLSHFHDEKTAVKLDLSTANQIESFDLNAIGREGACGWRPLRGFLLAAKRRNMRISRLHLSHSGLVNKDNSRVVGYGSWVAHLPESAEFSQMDRDHLYKIAAKAISHKVETNRNPQLDFYSSGHLLQTMLASFVTLELDGQLRGCIGSLKPHRALVDDVFQNALKSAFEDPRFPPLTKAEFERVECEIAILSGVSEIEYKDRDDLLSKLVPGEDGLILRHKNKSGTFLPKVWDNFTDPDQFLKALMRKSGLEEDFWSDDITILRYHTERFDMVKLHDYLS